MRDYLYRVITDRTDGFPAPVIRLFLWVCSLLYRLVIVTGDLCYQRNIFKAVDLGRPVISVGNLTWGGVGKTPFVIYLAEYLKARGFSPAVLLRGYMKGRGPSDEAEVLRQAVPGVGVGVGADRFKSAHQVILRQPVDVFILDDGFQHRKVKRGFNILLIDSNNPFGNGELLPRGILREPVEAMRRADVIVLTKTDINPSAAQVLEERIKRVHPACPVVWAVHQPISFQDVFSRQEKSLADWQVQKVMSFCSIGDPDHFAEKLSQLGMQTQRNFVFPDHHTYTAEDIQYIILAAKKEGVETLLTTTKDAVKIQSLRDQFGPVSCWALKIQFEIEVGKDGLLGRMDHLLGR